MFTRKGIVLILLFFNLVCFSQTEFITTWETTSASESITIPTNGGGYSYNVDWGDASLDDTGVSGDISHTYTTAGTYTVTITGTFNRIYFNGDATNAPKIKSIVQWGSARVWTSMNRAFEGCSNLIITDANAPILTSVTSCQRMFRNASSVGNGSTNFDLWNVSNVTNMSQMFRGASAFNQDLNSWNTISVTNMSNMFRDATNFNGNISSWTTTLVANMSRMFQAAASFNQNIGGWNTAAVTTMSFMFSGASTFNQNINGWIVSAVTNMDEMFRNATSFNQNLNSWNVANVTNMNEMFRDASDFNGNISTWTTTFALNMANMFYNASSFNQNIGGWTVNTVTNMSNMFRGAVNFNQNISGWDVSSVTTMASMFREATSFNQNIGGWTTTSLTNVGSMFRDNGQAFDQDIGSWNVSNVTNFNNMFNGSKLSVANYNALLVGWNAQSLQPGENLHAGTSRYCSPAAIAAKANMENLGGDNWNFTDGGVLTTFVWTGNTDTDWSDSTNWQDGYDSDCNLDVTIPSVTNHPIISTSTDVNIDNLTIDSGATLTINGSLTVGGNLTTNNGLTLNSASSIIVSGTSTGNLTYNRSLANAKEWYYISNPFVGQTIQNFIDTNSLAEGNGNVGLFYYDNDTSMGYLGTGFLFYKPTGSVDSFTSGQGYGTQVNASGDVTFTGTIPTADPVTITLNEGGLIDSANLIGNPFPSYLPTDNLITNNSSVLNEQTIWLWNNLISDYEVINVGSPSHFIPPGQGFFVNAVTDGVFEFDKSWQVHQASETFYKTSDTIYRIKLNIKNTSNQRKSTQIFYFDGKTTGFDNGYDSSSFSNETEDFSINTRLVGNHNSQNLAIQTLPTANLQDYVVPLLIKGNGKTFFSIELSNKPKDISHYLEDRELNTFTLIEPELKYTINSNGKSNGMGRFYLHSQNKSLTVDRNVLSKISMYTSKNKTLNISGLQEGKVIISVFDILGKHYKEEIFIADSFTKQVSLLGLKKGIYILKLETDKGILSKKIILE